jgi:hypothetical protein
MRGQKDFAAAGIHQTNLVRDAGSILLDSEHFGQRYRNDRSMCDAGGADVN